MTARESVLVAGGGIAGLFAALSLLEKGFSVTLVERDGPPPEPPLPDASRMVDDCQRDRVGDAFFNWPRPGAAQFRHPHAFLGLMCNFIEQHYPDL
ncbi:MAG: FAD-dependent oxidoreductase, partial [Gammaproteobacteria bacterium]|nr:FAD-dependent oxidoreductase [Gammaproteobacteria bacterium]